MKMKHLLMGLGMIPALLLSSCSNDEPAAANGNTPDNGESFFATITLSLPSTGSRSSTEATGGSTDGEEVGKDYENNIQTIVVVLATKDDNGNYKVVAINQGDAVPGAATLRPSYTLRFKQEDVSRIAGKEVYPFVICNPTANIASDIEGKDISVLADYIEKQTIKISDGNTAVWQPDRFLMTNAKEVMARAVPTNLSSYNTQENAFVLSSSSAPIYVERAVARFDFKQHTPSDASLALNEYKIVDNLQNNATVATVQLTDMTLVNDADEFYTFRRTSDAGDGDWTISGIETGYNYVTTPLFSTPDVRTYGQYLFSSGNASPAALTGWTALTSLVSKDTDATKAYNIWRYATENAIGKNVDTYKKYATGVVFRGHINFVPGSALEESTQGNTRNLYMYNQQMFGNYEDLQAEIKRAPNTSLAMNAKGLYTVDASGEYSFVPESDINTTVDLSSKGFTVYRPEDGKYLVHYYYWNRHNDNGDPAVTGNMEFAVVRNNVYKLHVQNISAFGHPSNPGDDPEPPGPDTPVEEVNMYFSLYVEVLPWTVRINNIEF